MPKLVEADEISTHIEPRRSHFCPHECWQAALDLTVNIFMTEWVAIFREKWTAKRYDHCESLRRTRHD